MPDLALDDVRVIDLSQGIAGTKPFSPRELAARVFFMNLTAFVAPRWPEVNRRSRLRWRSGYTSPSSARSRAGISQCTSLERGASRPPSAG